METQQQQNDVELRIRTLRMIWFALLSSIAIYWGLTLFVQRPEGVAENSMLSLVLAAVAASTAAASFLIKSKLLNRAIELRQTAQVQQAYVVAWAINEVAALLGIVDYFTTRNPYYFVLFLIAAGGHLLNFPRSEHVVNAAFKRTL